MGSSCRGKDFEQFYDRQPLQGTRERGEYDMVGGPLRFGSKLDRQMLSWCAAADLRTHILLTKFDKLGRGRGASALKSVDGEISSMGGFSVQPFSSVDMTGLDEARAVIEAWLET